MTRILYILMNHKSKSIKSKDFSFETIEFNDIPSKNLNEVYGDWKYYPFYLLEAIQEKQGKADLRKTKIGMFTQICCRL